MNTYRELQPYEIIQSGDEFFTGQRWTEPAFLPLGRSMRADDSTWIYNRWRRPTEEQFMKALINAGRTKTKLAAVFAMLKAANVPIYTGYGAYEEYHERVSRDLSSDRDLFILISDGRINGRGYAEAYSHNSYGDFLRIHDLETLEKLLASPPLTIQSDGKDYTVEFFRSGDVKVGCTTVPSATMEKIIKGRQDALVQA